MRQVRANKHFSVTGKLIRESEKAILINVKSIHGLIINSTSSMWFPKSQCEDLEMKEGVVEFMASEWILGEKGFAKDLEMGLSGEGNSDSEDPNDLGDMRSNSDDCPF